MRLPIALAVTVGVLSGAACFGSSAPPAPATEDAASTQDASPEPDGTLAEEGGVDAAPEGSPSPDAPAEATSDSVDAPSEASEAGSAGDSATDAAPDGTPAEASVADAGGGFVRVADMVPDLTSIDFCVKASSAASFTGPYMWLQEGLTIPYQSVSEYDSLAQASGYTVRIVTGGATDCSAGLVPDVPVGPSPATASTTVVLEGTSGDAGAPLRILTLTDDDPSTSPSGLTRMRAVHAASGVGAVDFQIGVTPYTQAIQAGVPYGSTFAAATATSGAPVPDAQGYIAPGYGQAQVTLVLGGVETTSFYVGNGSTPTASSTAFLVGASGSAGDPLGFVNCDELGTPSASTHLSPCTFSSAAPATTTIRIFHGAPDQGAVEVCAGLAPAGQPFSANLLAAAGISGGLAFAQLSGDLVTMPAGTSIKIGFVTEGQTCATDGQFLTIGTGLPTLEWTFAMFESALPPSTTYNAFLFDTQLGVSASQAGVDLGNLTDISSGLSIDLFATGSTSSQMQVGQAVAPEYSSGLQDLAADTYSLEVTDDSTQATLYSATGVTLGADEDYFMWWAQGSAESVLAVCPLSQRAIGDVASCKY
jgi:hypothetical protein